MKKLLLMGFVMLLLYCMASGATIRPRRKPTPANLQTARRRAMSIHIQIPNRFASVTLTLISKSCLTAKF